MVFLFPTTPRSPLHPFGSFCGARTSCTCSPRSHWRPLPQRCFRSESICVYPPTSDSARFQKNVFRRRFLRSSFPPTAPSFVDSLRSPFSPNLALPQQSFPRKIGFQNQLFGCQDVSRFRTDRRNRSLLETQLSRSRAVHRFTIVPRRALFRLLLRIRKPRWRRRGNNLAEPLFKLRRESRKTSKLCRPSLLKRADPVEVENRK